MTHKMLVFVPVVLILVGLVQGKKGVGDGDQDWGYITVRPHAHIFWWLYYTTYNVSSYTERPLIIWLQGGPGMPSSGYGNFLEVGPLDATLQKREGSFVEKFNVLFIDNPVGVGYSYISDPVAKLTKNGDEIGEDLYNFLKIFLNTTHPEFKNVPIYIFGESYGGKMAVELAYTYMTKEHNKTEKLCNLKGIGLGDAYISPIDYANHHGPLAYELGLIDKKTLNQMNNLAKELQRLIQKHKFKTASIVETKILDYVKVDLYNINEKIKYSMPSLFNYYVFMENLMNGKMKETLNITSNVTWEFVHNDVQDALGNDLIKSVTYKVEALLNTTNIKIIVYNGILDYLVNTAGTISWLENLNWKGQKQWLEKEQNNLLINGTWEAHYKRVDNLSFYAILRAGHSVPMDNLHVLNWILQLELQ